MSKKITNSFTFVEEFWNSIDNQLFKEYLVKQNKLILMNINEDTKFKRKVVYTLEPANRTRKSMWNKFLEKVKREKNCKISQFSYVKDGINYSKQSIFTKLDKYIKVIIAMEWQHKSQMYIHMRILYNCDCKQYPDNFELEFRDCAKCRNKVLKKLFRVKDSLPINIICLINSKNPNIKIPVKDSPYEYLAIDLNSNICNLIN